MAERHVRENQGECDDERCRTRRLADQASAEVTTPWFSAKTQGGTAVILVLCAAIIGAAAYLIKQHDVNVEGRLMAIEQTMVKSIKVQEGMLYLFTKSDSDRQEMNLAKPDIIREMENGRK